MKKQLYDELCKLLTDYEDPQDTIPPNIEDFYIFLVKLQNNWQTIKE